MARALLCLRSNVFLAGDSELALVELESLLPDATFVRCDGPAAWMRAAGELDGLSLPDTVFDDALRLDGAGEGSICFASTLTPEQISTVLARATFVQLVIALAGGGERERFAAQVRIAPHARRWSPPLFIGVPAQCVVELASLVAARAGAAATEDLERTLDLLVGRPGNDTDLKRLRRLLSRRRSGGYLAHDLHVYKAKFFPRLARVVLNLVLPADAGDDAVLLDPFAGSGTALVEAARLGVRSLGVDIDPLSASIARGKLSLPTLDAAPLRALLAGGVLERAPAAFEPRIALPPWLVRKLTDVEYASLIAEVNAVGAAIDALPAGAERTVAALCLSDALTRKLRMRFLGTGVGRFALELARPSLRRLFLRRLEVLCAEVTIYGWLAGRGYGLNAPASLARGDARKLPLADGFAAAALTSPPYLPASSGRENYLLSKAPSLVLLGLMSADELRGLDRRATGSMGASETAADGGRDVSSQGADTLSREETRLVDWLAADSLRAIKAEPVRRYFLDLRAALRELRRSLRPGARAAVVIGTRSTFYRFRTREPIYTVETAQLLADAAVSLGFSVDRMLDVELDKGNRNARPRSLDAYSETVLILRADRG